MHYTARTRFGRAAELTFLFVVLVLCAPIIAIGLAAIFSSLL